jgi:hypothetical protein
MMAPRAITFGAGSGTPTTGHRRNGEVWNVALKAELAADKMRAERAKTAPRNTNVARGFGHSTERACIRTLPVRRRNANVLASPPRCATLPPKAAPQPVAVSTPTPKPTPKPKQANTGFGSSLGTHRGVVELLPWQRRAGTAPSGGAMPTPAQVSERLQLGQPEQ